MGDADIAAHTMPSKGRTVPWLVAVLGCVAALAGAMRAGWAVPRVDPATSPWIVGVVAVAAAGVALLLAGRMGLVRLVRARFPRPVAADQCVDELTTLAARVSDHGVLSVAGDAVARRYPLLMSGLHLLCEDADRLLVRATLESQSEAHLGRAASSRAGKALVVRAAQVGSGMWLLGSLLRAALTASTPAMIGADFGLSLLLSFVAFALSLAASPFIAWLHRCAASEEFVAAASLETVMSMQSRDDAAAVRARLMVLLPGPRRRELPDRARIAA